MYFLRGRLTILPNFQKNAKAGLNSQVLPCPPNWAGKWENQAMPLHNPHSPERAEREYLDSVLSHLAKAQAALDIAYKNVASNLTKSQLQTADAELTAVINSLTPRVLSQSDLKHLQLREDRRAQEKTRVGQLNAQELRVFALLAEGMSNQEIADTINLSQNTIRNYVSMILDKLGLSNRTEIALLSQRRSDEL